VGVVPAAEQRVTRPVARSLAVRIGFSGVAQVIPLLTNLAITPYLIRVLGLDQFGVWALVIALLATLTVLDGGVGASLVRFYAFHDARGDKASIGRLVAGSMLLFLTFGALVSLVGLALAPSVVHLLKIPRALEHEAVLVLRLFGPLVALALITNSATSLLQATSRFAALSAVTLGSSVVYVVAVVLLVGGSSALPMLVAATALRYAVLLLGGLGLAARAMSFRRPLLPEAPVRREFRRYAVRMQVSGITMVVNGEMDALVIGALLPVRNVGLYMVGYQAATALRSLPLYAFPPLHARMTGVFARAGLPGAVAEFDALQERWLPVVLGYGVVATSAIGFGVEIWLGHGYGTSSLVAIVLMAGYTVHIAVTGMRTCFVRSVGRPGLETRYSLVAMALNLVLTVPCAVLFGVVGVVAATATGIVAGSFYFARLCSRLADLHDAVPSARVLLSIAIAVAITILGEMELWETQLHGALPLLLAGVPALAGLTLVVVQATRGAPRA
jgi:O-antigen/teichoic acid export membrane protein